MTRVMYILSDINKAVAFEWIAEALDKKRFALSFVFLNPSPSYLEEHLRQAGFPVHSIRCSSKKDWPAALYQILRLLKQERPKVVHCHLIQATIIGLMAARIAGVTNRIYTRHHSSLHHIYFKKGIWWDRLSNKLATKIVAISGIVRRILIEWEGADPSKIVLIPHGFQFTNFDEVASDAVAAFKLKYGLANRGPIIGVVSRLTEWKGVQFIIPAFEKLHKEYPDAVLLLLNATGDYEPVLRKQLQSLPESSYRLIAFENNIAAAYRNMDVFVHVPIDDHSEAFGQIYVEALAARVPSIFTMSGIAPDFIKDGQNACVVPFRDAASIFEKMKWLLTHDRERIEMSERGFTDAGRFTLDEMIRSLEQLYAEA